jgi:hypothetical protein
MKICRYHSIPAPTNGYLKLGGIIEVPSSPSYDTMQNLSKQIADEI